MSILIENKTSYQLDFDFEKVAHTVIGEALRSEECPYESEVDITLIDDEEIRQLNNEYRNLDQSTDVLSFPLVEFTKPAKYDIIFGGDASYFNPENGELMLGDIIISVPTMIRQAKEYGHDTKREFAFLVAHSILHLLGYDHMEEPDAKIMEIKQTAILTHLNITR